MIDRSFQSSAPVTLHTGDSSLFSHLCNLSICSSHRFRKSHLGREAKDPLLCLSEIDAVAGTHVQRANSISSAQDRTDPFSTVLEGGPTAASSSWFAVLPRDTPLAATDRGEIGDPAHVSRDTQPSRMRASFPIEDQ